MYVTKSFFLEKKVHYVKGGSFEAQWQILYKSFHAT